STNPEDYEEEKKMATLKDLLNEFAKLQGVTTVCLVGRDGFLLDSIATMGIDTEMIGAIASSGFGASESMGRQLGKGAMSMTMIEFENGPVLFAPVGEDAFIVIIAEKESNLGMVRLKLKKHCNEIANAAAI
ncbi:MAG: roadblock/LC7 domain-containing protein, partial [Nitrospirota bacterium]|nr:roadblock/LC7 domain-containing protein [Nitrospirota bacterium]